MNTDNLPESVRKQHEEAERMKTEMQARRDNTPAQPNPATSVASQDRAATSSAPDPETQVVSAGTPTNPTAPASVPQAAPINKNMADSAMRIAALETEKAELRKKLDTVHGTFGGEVQHLKSTIFDLQRQLGDMKAVKATEAKPAIPAEGNVETPEEGSSEHLQYVTEDMIDRYGPEFFDMVAKIAKGVSDTNSKKFIQLAESTASKVSDVESRLEAEKFWSEVEKVAVGARNINGDPERGISAASGWGDFLDKPVRLGSTLTRRMEAEDAVSKGDALAFATLVKEFQLENGHSVVTSPSRPSIAAQAMPRSVTGNTPQAPVEPAGKRQIPQSEIERFRADAGKGKYTIEEANSKTPAGLFICQLLARSILG